jgi:hypothetical protein
MELPVLRLGLAGFTPEQEARIGELTRATHASHWVCGPLHGADAWLINGARTQLLGEGSIRVAAGVAGGRSVRLELQASTRPVCFALPPPARMEPACTCDLDDAASVAQTLATFETWLQCVKAQFLLAAHIIEHQHLLLGGFFELRVRGRVLGMLDMRGDSAVSAAVEPADFQIAEWARASRERTKLPENFCRMSFEKLMWQYCQRTLRDALPERYRNGLIYFRRPPRVDQHLIGDDHLRIMSQLAFRPCTFDDLQRRLGIGGDALAHALAALYYVGSITSNPQKMGETTQGRLTPHVTAPDQLAPVAPVDGIASDGSPTSPLLH